MKVKQKLEKVFYMMISVCTLAACSIDISIHSERTSLENQIIGTHKEIDQNLLMLSSVRAVDSDGTIKADNRSQLAKKAAKARQNQNFNQDDIYELKEVGIIGEGSDGLVKIVPENLQPEGQEGLKRLAKVLVVEENQDRKMIWERIIQVNESISKEDIDTVRQTYRKQKIDESPDGTWILDDNNQWQRK